MAGLAEAATDAVIWRIRQNMAAQPKPGKTTPADRPKRNPASGDALNSNAAMRA